MLNIINLSQQLIKYPSITPDHHGTIDFLEQQLKNLGFNCQKFIFTDPKYNLPVENLYARLGNNGKNLCFAGHTDVVSPGDLHQWSADPFSGIVINNQLYGRGAVDMKCAIACFILAVANVIKKSTLFKNSISMLITGDEEGYGINGTAKVLENLKQQNEQIDLCIVGEPSNPNFLGEMIKIGRRGSLNVILEIYGLQGHVAYPEYAHNPIKDLFKAFNALNVLLLDQGNKYFQTSNLEFTSIDIGNNTCNIIPNKVTSKFNVRFNNNYNATKIIQIITECLNNLKINYKLITDPASEPFINYPKKLCNLLANAIEKVTGNVPTLGTNGGTSDARFIQEICPVVEFGLVAKTAHQIDEHVAIKDLFDLQTIYSMVIKKHLQS